MDVRAGLWRKLSTEELMLLNCGVGEDSRESLWTAMRSNWSILKEISSEYSLQGLMLKLELQYFGHLTHKKRPWCWERLKTGREGDDRGWDDWMASSIQWTCIWANSGRWWRTGKPGVLQSMGSQRVGHDLATEQHQIYRICVSRKMIPKPIGWPATFRAGTWYSKANQEEGRHSLVSQRTCII